MTPEEWIALQARVAIKNVAIKRDPHDGSVTILINNEPVMGASMVTEELRQALASVNLHVTPSG